MQAQAAESSGYAEEFCCLLYLHVRRFDGPGSTRRYVGLAFPGTLDRNGRSNATAISSIVGKHGDAMRFLSCNLGRL
jgi:hypothetical protein